MNSTPITEENQTPDSTSFSREIEEAVLGAVLINPSCLSDLNLYPIDFYVNRHRWIFEAMRSLYDQKVSIDYVTLVDRLTEQGRIEDVGGPAYIAGILNATPTSLNARDYARLLRDKTRQRKMKALIGEVAQRAYGNNGDVAIDDLLPRFAEIAQSERVDPWQIFTLADAYAPRDPVEYVAGNLFAIPSLNIPYGAPGTLKSFLMADLAVCVAAGVDWLPPAPWIDGNQARAIKTHQCPVMWLDFDNGRRRTHDRFAALGHARDLPPDIPLFYYSMPSPWLDASDNASIGDLALRIKDAGAKLVVVDNLGVVSGDADENSAEMGQVMSRFRQVAEDAGSVIIPVHHQRKSTGSTGRAGDALRGHSSIEASLDLALWIEREEYGDICTIKATKTRGDIVLPFSAAFTYDHDEAGELIKAKFYGIAAEDTRSGPAIERAILTVLQGTSMNKTDLTNAVKEELKDEAGKAPGVNRIRDMVDRLTTIGKLKTTPGERTERIYSLK